MSRLVLPGREVLRYAGYGTPAYVELSDGRWIATRSATRAELLEAAEVREAIARAHQEEADTIRALAKRAA